MAGDKLSPKAADNAADGAEDGVKAKKDHVSGPFDGALNEMSRSSRDSARDRIYRFLYGFHLDKTQTTIILCGFYIFFALAGNIAATKVVSFGSLVMDAGFIYSVTFTWRDLIHKQLGRSAAITTIFMSAAVCLIAALYFQLVVLLPAQPEWAESGGQASWKFLFGIVDASGGPWWQSVFSLQLRIVIGSIITMVLAELCDTYAYQIWTSGIGRGRPEWTRVFASNAVSIPVDSILFTVIAFTGIIGADAMVQMVSANITVKAIITILSFWTIYLVPDRPVYRDEHGRNDQLDFR